MKSLRLLSIVFLISFSSIFSLTSGEKASFPQTSRLCGNATDGIYRFHNETQSCHKVGDKGPCGDLMVFYAHPNDEEKGQCDCDLQYRCNRPLVYWPSLDRCFLAYDQGPCDEESWLTFSWNLEPICTPNMCTANFTEFDEVPNEFWFYYENQCILTGTQGQCPFSNEITQFNGFSHHMGPYCSPVTFECKLPEIPSLVCVPGQKWHRVEGCGLWDPNPKPKHVHRHSHRANRHREHGQHRHRHHHGFKHGHHHQQNRTSEVDDVHRQPSTAVPSFQQPSNPTPLPRQSTTTTSGTPLPLPTIAPTRSTNQRPLPQVSDPNLLDGNHNHHNHNHNQDFHESQRFRNSGRSHGFQVHGEVMRMMSHNS